MRYLTIIANILRRPRYGAVALSVAVMAFTAAVWLPNLALIGVVLQSSISLLDKLAFLGSVYGSITTNFTVVSAAYTILICVLFGLLMALLGYYIVVARASAGQLRGAGSAGLGGIVSGALGIGCAACGTFILTTILAVFGAGGMVAFLPFGGEEFGLLGVVLLLYSISRVVKKIDTPFTCPI